MLAVRCPHCLHAWNTEPTGGPVPCPVCGRAVVATPAAAVETGFSLPLPSSGTSAGEGCAPAAGEPPAFLAPPQAPGELGQVGRYRVLRELGAGGMGVVYEAEDTQLLRRVALKVMHPETARHGDGKARFLREARAAAALTHDHIVPIHDVGEQGGAPFLVMALLRGETLEARLKRTRRPLPLAEALRIGREVAEGLAAAHEAGLVHRDVKPANVWLEAPAARVKLLDFGLARLSEGDAVKTRSGAVLGTPAYMSPEQAAGGKGVDARADLFSLGAVLYEMLTGTRAFKGDSWMEVLANRLRMKPATPHEVNADVPEEVSALVMRLLAEEPAQRPSSARQVARQVGALAAPVAESLHLSRQDGRPTTPPPARRWPVVVGAAVVLLLGLAGGWALRPGQPTGGEPKTGGPGPTAADGTTALTFAAALHDATREGLPARPARREAALAFGEGLHTAASARLLALREEKLRAERARLEAIARRQGEREAREAAVAFGGALHEAARPAVPGEAASFGNSVGMKMVRIRPGRFRMGAPDGEKGASAGEKPQHEVEISHAFYLAEATVTVGQFRRFVEDRASHGGTGYLTDAERDGEGGRGYNEATRQLEGRDPKYTWKNTGWKRTDEHPVVNVSWNDASAFCKWLSKKEGRAYRLPTSAEWEYACRAGTTTRFFFGDDVEGLAKHANVADASFRRTFPDLGYGGAWDDGFAFTAPVKSFEPSPWKLYDMHGNVFQWCADGKRKYEPGPARDPVGPEDGDRLVRGGSWSNPGEGARSAAGSSPKGLDYRNNNVGFRVACSPSR
jgi:formylglycine-generating enzyme required for sulfatase activity